MVPIPSVSKSIIWQPCNQQQLKVGIGCAGQFWSGVPYPPALSGLRRIVSVD